MKPLRQFLYDADAELFRHLEAAWDIAQDWLPSLNMADESHSGLPHIRSVERWIDKVSEACRPIWERDQTTPFGLNALEMYVLLASVLFHDIGRGRAGTNPGKKHGEVSKEILHGNWAQLGVLNARVADEIGRIADFHTRDHHGWDDDRIVRIHPWGTVHTYDLACLLTLADELDTAFTRATPDYLRAQEYDLSRQATVNIADVVKIATKGYYREYINEIDLDPSSRIIKHVVRMNQLPDCMPDDHGGEAMWRALYSTSCNQAFQPHTSFQLFLWHKRDELGPAQMRALRRVYDLQRRRDLVSAADKCPTLGQDVFSTLASAPVLLEGASPPAWREYERQVVELDAAIGLVGQAIKIAERDGLQGQPDATPSGAELDVAQWLAYARMVHGAEGRRTTGEAQPLFTTELLSMPAAADMAKDECDYVAEMLRNADCSAGRLARSIFRLHMSLWSEQGRARRPESLGPGGVARLLVAGVPGLFDSRGSCGKLEANDVLLKKAKQYLHDDLQRLAALFRPYAGATVSARTTEYALRFVAMDWLGQDVRAKRKTLGELATGLNELGIPFETWCIEYGNHLFDADWRLVVEPVFGKRDLGDVLREAAALRRNTWAHSTYLPWEHLASRMRHSDTERVRIAGARLANLLRVYPAYPNGTGIANDFGRLMSPPVRTAEPTSFRAAHGSWSLVGDVSNDTIEGIATWLGNIPNGKE
jgi:hypothetical protein